MRSLWQVLLVSTLLVVPALGQDSVSSNLGGLPGDALSPWAADQQCAPYVVDLAPFQTSWGTEFAIAPLVKSGKVDAGYFNNLASAQSMSRLQALSVPYPTMSYYEWVGQPGYGVHPTENLVPEMVTPGGVSNQFAVAFADFGTTANDEDYNGINGALVNYDPAAPNRLYVTRVTAATNGLGPAENRSQFGMGAVDEFGNVMFRADGFGTSGPNALNGNNIQRVDMAARDCDVVNYFDNDGFADVAAGSWIVQRSSTTYNVPNVGPASQFGGTAYMLGGNFNSQYVYGPTNPPTQTGAHLATGSSDHRGAVAYMSKVHPCTGGEAGTGAILVKYNSAETNGINLWGIAADGAPVNPIGFGLPATLQDYVTGVTNIPGANQFDHYHSQVAYRGGTSQVALNVDPFGNLLAAAVAYHPTQFSDNPLNYIAVLRLGPNCEEQWSIAAYSTDNTVQDRTGKPILDGPGGNVIGNLTTLADVTGGSPLGPSMSAPMIDAAGNIWFIAAAALYKEDQQGEPFTDTDSVLLRGVYTADWMGTGNPGWELELVFEIGNVFDGVNSGLPWQVGFLNIADSNSVTSGTAWSQNISETGHLGMLPGPDVPAVSNTTLGGLVLTADIIYDVDGDGNYNDPTSSFYDPELPADEAYQTLLYIAANDPGQQQGCPGDMDCDGDIDFDDISPFVAAIGADPDTWEAQYNCIWLNGDIDNDGDVDFDDISPFVALIGTQCN